MSTPTPTGNPGAILPGLPALSSCKVQNAGFEKADKDIADLINGLVSVRRDVEELKDYVRNGFTETNSRLGALEKDVAELKGDVAELKGDVAEIKGGMHKVLAALQMSFPLSEKLALKATINTIGV
ncbi:hypothetical protein FRC10_009207 [Ceratobasidium sp. 414]|nr:hypothetical protein FRC10_009207 [Ceratobasidium sp. 414]